MNVQYHFFFGILFAALLYFLFSPIISLLGLLIIFLSSVFIDVDHYFYYIYKRRNLSPIKAYRWYMRSVHKFRSIPKERRKEIYIGFCIFHGIEMLIILFLLGLYVSPIFNFILIGFLFHLSADLVSETILGQRLDKISIIQNFLRNKKLVSLEDFEMH